MIALDELSQFLTPKGASLVACADLSELPADCRQSLPRAVSIGVCLSPAAISEIVSGPTPEYVDEYIRANKLLAELAELAAQHLRGRGATAVACAPTVGTADAETLTSPLPHKTVATRAGLGWIGRCALLITKQHGSAQRLTTVLTDADLPVGKPVNESRCGVCKLCVQACPGGAITGEEWSAGVPREHIYDAHKCLEVCNTHAEQRGLERQICGICISVCPWTMRYLDEHR